MKLMRLPAEKIVVIAVALLGLTVFLGWSIGNESMVRVLPYSVAMALNTALLFIAASVGLSFPACIEQQPIRNFIRAFCGWLLVLLPTLILFEHWRDINLGIDWPALHALVKDGNPRPGRTAPNTCLGFFLTGLVFLSYRRAQRHQFIPRLIACLTYAIFTIGLTALLGYVLNLELLYQFATYNRMAAPTAAGMTLIGMGLWLRLSQAPWRKKTAQESADKRITRTAAAVLTVVVVIAGLTGFTILKQGFEESTSAALLRSTKNNASTFSTTIDQGLVIASSITSRPILQQYLLRLHDNPRDQEALRLVEAVGKSILSFGVTGITFLSSDGESLGAVGTIVKPKADMAVVLQSTAQKAALLWQDNFVLWTETKLVVGGRDIGKIVIEQRMPALSAVLQEAKAENSSTDVLVCGRELNDAVCFPSKFYKANLHIPMFKDGKPNLAISRALLDKTGVLSVKDLRSTPVLAGYAPIGTLGLGLVLKTDTVELFGPIRDRLNLFAVLLVSLVVAGTLILRNQVQPLARRVVKDQYRMQVIMASLDEAFVEFDESGIIKDWNGEAERTFGWTRKEAIGKAVTDLIRPSTAGGYHNVISEFLTASKDVVVGKRVELTGLHRTGKEFPLELTVSVIKTENTQSFAAFMRDTSDRKQAELHLRESEHRFLSFMNHTPAVAFMKDEDGRMIFANKSFEEAFSFQEVDWKNKSDTELWPAEVATPLRQNDLKIFASGVATTLEEKVPTDQGDRIWITHKFPLRLASGHQLIGGIAFDITARKQIEDDLFKEKESLRVTLSSIGDAVITTDTDGNVTYLNPVAEQMTGWSNAEANGLPLPEVFYTVDENDGEITSNPVALVLLQGQTDGLVGSTVLIGRSGARHPIENSAAPIRDQDNNISGVVLVFHDVSHARKMVAEMTHQATHDALTGLYNRREFERRVELALKTGKEGDKQHTLLYLDLDQFKIVNDTCGHVAGDELLRQLSTLLRDKLRQSDTLARLGGDEFGVLLDSCGTESALRIAEVLRLTVSDFHFVWLDKVFPIGVSIGLVTFANDGITLADILKMADIACYISKDSGRNRVHVYEELDQKLIQRHGEMGWIGRLQKALDENRFVLYSQKIQSTRSEHDAGNHFELLIRIHDEDGSVVPPMAFIPAAERYGLMPTIDRWVIRTACSHYAARRSRGESPDKYAINLSGTSICDEQFLPFVLEQFAVHRIPPGDICFEITETAAIVNLNQAVALIKELKAIGCQFSLDDFGSGMSSFGYLKHLPVDFLKIDGGFVKDILDDPIDRAMVEAIHNIGHVMGLQTIAEYVENDAIADVLREIGIDFVQGFGIEKPSPLR